MQTHHEDLTVRSEQRSAMLRVFGGTALAFITLFIVALLVRPDLMQATVGMVMSIMP